MTKQELLEIMHRHGACHLATLYVETHESDDASVIISRCNNINWLLWLLGRERRLTRFVRVCEKRAIRMNPARKASVQESLRWFNPNDYSGTACSAGILANHARWAAYDSVKGYAFEKDAALNAEKSKQLKGLQRIGRNWANGLPAER